MSRSWGSVGLAYLLLGAGCGKQADWPGPQYGAVPRETRVNPVYRVAVHPLYNPQKLAKDYQPLIAYLNSHITGVHFELESSRDYGAFEQKYRAREPQFLQPNPWQTLDAMKAGYVVLAMAGEPQDFKGLVLVRKDSGIQTVRDLRGRTVAYPAPTALAAAMMPQLYFLEHGLDPMKDLDNRYVGTQESSIMNVFSGLAAAGCTWPPPWRAFQKEHPSEAAELRVAWATAPLVNNSFMASGEVPKELRDQVQELLVNLQQSPQGQAVLQTMQTVHYARATAGDYAVVQDFMATFERRVRPAEQR